MLNRITNLNPIPSQYTDEINSTISNIEVLLANTNALQTSYVKSLPLFQDSVTNDETDIYIKNNKISTDTFKGLSMSFKWKEPFSNNLYTGVRIKYGEETFDIKFDNSGSYFLIAGVVKVEKFKTYVVIEGTLVFRTTGLTGLYFVTIPFSHTPQRKLADDSELDFSILDKQNIETNLFNPLTFLSLDLNLNI